MNHSTTINFSGNCDATGSADYKKAQFRLAAISVKTLDPSHLSGSINPCPGTPADAIFRSVPRNHKLVDKLSRQRKKISTTLRFVEGTPNSDNAIFDVFPRLRLTTHGVFQFNPIDRENIHHEIKDVALRKATLSDAMLAANVEKIFTFVDHLHQMLHESRSSAAVVLHTKHDSGSLTYAALLIGTYLVLRHRQSPDEAADRLRPLSALLLPGAFNDDPGGMEGSQETALRLQDYWAGLRRAHRLGWTRGFDPDEYEHYSSLLNADMHELVPGKLVAMQGPTQMAPGQLWRDVEVEDGLWRREFNPAYYAELLRNSGCRRWCG